MILFRKRLRKSEIFLTTRSGNFTNKLDVKCDETGDKPEEIVDNKLVDTDNDKEDIVEIVDNQILDTDNDKENVADVIDEHVYENLGNVIQENVEETGTDLNDGGSKLGEDLCAKDCIVSETEVLEGMIYEQI